jgi:hypothetical protein
MRCDKFIIGGALIIAACCALVGAGVTLAVVALCLRALLTG